MYSRTQRWSHWNIWRSRQRCLVYSYSRTQRWSHWNIYMKVQVTLLSVHSGSEVVTLKYMKVLATLLSVQSDSEVVTLKYMNSRQPYLEYSRTQRWLHCNIWMPGNIAQCTVELRGGHTGIYERPGNLA